MLALCMVRSAQAAQRLALRLPRPAPRGQCRTRRSMRGAAGSWAIRVVRPRCRTAGSALRCTLTAGLRTQNSRRVGGSARLQRVGVLSRQRQSLLEALLRLRAALLVAQQRFASFEDLRK